jgi:electron transport complex protein RnfB
MKRASVALIDEARCIGCTLCIRACPVDAIVGADQLMHTVIEEYCTGCELCLPPCPVDCIAMLPAPAGRPWTSADANAAKQRGARRKARIRRDDERPTPTGADARAARRSAVAAALERVRARRAARSGAKS